MEGLRTSAWINTTTAAARTSPVTELFCRIGHLRNNKAFKLALIILNIRVDSLPFKTRVHLYVSYFLYYLFAISIYFLKSKHTSGLFQDVRGSNWTERRCRKVGESCNGQHMALRMMGPQIHYMSRILKGKLVGSPPWILGNRSCPADFFPWFIRITIEFVLRVTHCCFPFFLSGFSTH